MRESLTMLMDTKRLLTWVWWASCTCLVFVSGRLRGPRFDAELPRHVSTQTGQTVRINCRVYNLGSETVSWVRKKDFNILTIATTKFTQDERFHILHQQDSLDWTLQLKLPTPEDAGQYECQVSTTPKIAFVVDLNIVPGEAEIYGLNSVEVGSDLMLRCNVSGPAPPDYLDWRLNGTLLRSAPRQGINIKVDRKGKATLSTLHVKDMSYDKAGLYSCSPALDGVRSERGPSSANLRTGRELTGPPPPDGVVVARHHVQVIPASKHLRLWNGSSRSTPSDSRLGLSLTSLSTTILTSIALLLR